MKAAVVLALICLFSFAFALLDPAGMDRTEEELTRLTRGSRYDDDVCGSANMNFYWGGIDAAELGATPRIAEIFFYYDNTFVDNTYGYTGEWLLFGEQGDTIMVFDYPSAKYVSPGDTGSGSMISNGICGHWDFADFKWYCPNACDE